MEIIPNEALVVRGGRNRPEDIQRATGTHPTGITGISVECAIGLSLAELAVTIPHRQVGVTTELMTPPKIFADFHNADKQGRLRLNGVGTIEDLSRQKIKLESGQMLTLYSEELEVDGMVQYSEKESLWVPVIDWNQIREIEEIIPSNSSLPN